MSLLLIATKTHIPVLRPDVIIRQRLIDQLNNNPARKLSLVSAPAGSGKTTLVLSWVQQSKKTVGWLSLDSSDNSYANFLSYILQALQTIDKSVGAETLALLESSQMLLPEVLLTTLINEVAGYPDNFLLVIDDYHLIKSPEIHKALAFLVDHQPQNMHLVILTREVPELALARLRARNQVVELYETDLRFNAEEIGLFLETMGLHLPAESISALSSRTEGWITGLQLAALSMQKHQNVSQFIDSFSGSHRFVLDYLIGETIANQSARIQDFLLNTSILEHLYSDLCDTVMEETGAGQQILAFLERANLFLIQLDNERHWYRYHHLFRQVLFMRLQETHPERIPLLHHRAGTWYQQNGYHIEAIPHLVKAADYEQAAHLLELIWPEMHSNLQTDIWLNMTRSLPESLVLERGVLCGGYAWSLLDVGDLEQAECWLLHADAFDNSEPEFRATLAAARAYLSQARGDIQGTIENARRVLELDIPTGSIHSTQALALLGLTYWTSGDLRAADRTFTKFTLDMLSAGRILDVIGTAFILAEIQMDLGQLNRAESTLNQVLRVIQERGEPYPIGTSELYRVLGLLELERGNLIAAEQHLSMSTKLSNRGGLANYQSRHYQTLARLRLAQHKLGDAQHLLERAVTVYVRTPLPEIIPTSALLTRLSLAQGALSQTETWMQECELTVDDDLSYSQEYNHIVLARVLIAHFNDSGMIQQLQMALKLLNRLADAAEQAGRYGRLIEILILQALAYQAPGNTPKALTCLNHALNLAEAEGYIQMFIDEGAPMLDLLHQIDAKRFSPTYIDNILHALQLAYPPPVPQQLIEPLSNREYEVLRLLTAALSGPEIAEKLMISLNTLRTHTKHIYDKLGVNNRRSAVNRAQELDLL